MLEREGTHRLEQQLLRKPDLAPADMPQTALTIGQGRLTIAVPNLDAYDPHTGIGRVFASLRAYWGAQMQWVDARQRVLPLPILRNIPLGIQVQGKANLVLIPRLTGAQALRNTGGVPGVVIRLGRGFGERDHQNGTGRAVAFKQQPQVEIALPCDLAAFGHPARAIARHGFRSFLLWKCK